MVTWNLWGFANLANERHGLERKRFACSLPVLANVNPCFLGIQLTKNVLPSSGTSYESYDKTSCSSYTSRPATFPSPCHYVKTVECRISFPWCFLPVAFKDMMIWYVLLPSLLGKKTAPPKSTPHRVTAWLPACMLGKFASLLDLKTFISICCWVMLNWDRVRIKPHEKWKNLSPAKGPYFFERKCNIFQPLIFQGTCWFSGEVKLKNHLIRLAVSCGTNTLTVTLWLLLRNWHSNT